MYRDTQALFPRDQSGLTLKGGPQLADRADTADHIHKYATDRYAPYLRALLYLLFLRCSCDVEMSFNSNVRVISKFNYSTTS